MKIDSYRNATERFLKSFSVHWESVLTELGNEQSQLISGNRLRPQICLWGYLSTIPASEIDGNDFDRIADIAVSIEMVHKASLLLDDWLDGDNERHGAPTFHIEYGAQYTVLFAINMIGLALQRLKKTSYGRFVAPSYYSLCVDELIRTVYSMANGALKELQLQKKDLFNKEKILEVTEFETSEIISNSMLIGYYAGIGDKHRLEIEEVFRRVGGQCGYMFQSLNDLEAFVNPQKLKDHKGTINFDLFMHRKNLVVAGLYYLARKKDKVILESATEEDLVRLAKKYDIVNNMKAELSVVYKSILSAGSLLHKLGLPQEWCDGYTWFLENVKNYAEERIQ